MSHYFLYDRGPKRELARFITSYVPGEWDVPWKGKVKSKGWMSVRAAITAIVKCDSLSSLLQACIAYRGDVDTVAAIALGAASASSEIEQDLPEALISGLEDGQFGREYIVQLDEQLLGRFAVKH